MTTHERAVQIYQVLIGCAHHRQVLTYEILGKQIGMPARALAPCLGHLMRYCKKNGLPPITVLVVQTNTGKPGEGFTTFEDLHKDRERVFNHEWYKAKPLTVRDLLDS
jgi:hypothetical protein